MANFAKVTPIDMGLDRNKFLSDGLALASEVFTACASNGAGTPKYGAYFEMTERDDKYLIIIKNANASSAAKDVTIKAGGNKIFGSGNDLVYADLAAGDIQLVKIDSGRFKCTENVPALATLANISSTKGCVVIEGESTDIQVAVIKMPA